MHRKEADQGNSVVIVTHILPGSKVLATRTSPHPSELEQCSSTIPLRSSHQSTTTDTKCQFHFRPSLLVIEWEHWACHRCMYDEIEHQTHFGSILVVTSMSFVPPVSFYCSHTNHLRTWHLRSLHTKLRRDLFHCCPLHST